MHALRGFEVATQQSYNRQHTLLTLQSSVLSTKSKLEIVLFKFLINNVNIYNTHTRVWRANFGPEAKSGIFLRGGSAQVPDTQGPYSPLIESSVQSKH